MKSSFKEKKRQSIYAYFGYDRFYPEVNLYFWNLFNEKADIHFEVDVTSGRRIPTRLERNIRKVDAFIGVYPSVNKNIFPGTKNNRVFDFQLEIDIAFRSRKPSVVFYDEELSSLLQYPPPVRSMAFDTQEILNRGSKPSKLKHLHVFDEFLKETISSTKYELSKKIYNQISNRIVVLVSNNSTIYTEQVLSLIHDTLADMNYNVNIFPWGPVLSTNLYLELHQAELVVLCMEDSIQDVAISSFLEGYFVPIVRLIYSEDSKKNISVLSSPYRIYSDSMINWHYKKDLQQSIRDVILKIIKPYNRIDSYELGVDYISSNHLKSDMVFLSYTENDQDIARALRLELEKSFKIVIDYRDGKSIFSGEIWREQVKELLKQSSVAIPIISSSYINSKNCLDELKHMMVLKEKSDLVILPVKVDREKIDLPYDISEINYARYWEYDNIEMLSKRIIDSYINIKQK